MRRKQAPKRPLKWLSAAVFGITATLFTQGCALQGEEFEGTWVVTETVQPGISAMNEEAANTQLGRSLTYLEDQAQLDQRHCASPQYDTQYLQPDELTRLYRVNAAMLFTTGDKVQQIKVSCEDQGAPFGETLLMQPDGTAYTVSDGVFFRLEKTDVQAG